MFKFIWTLIVFLLLGFAVSAQTQNPQTALNGKSLQLIDKPRANYTEEARQKKAHGTVSLRVTFLASGGIGDVTVVKAKKKLQKTGLVAQAVEAAKKIKFIPAERDGKSISVAKIVQYNFNLY